MLVAANETPPNALAVEVGTILELLALDNTELELRLFQEIARFASTGERAAMDRLIDKIDTNDDAE